MTTAIFPPTDAVVELDLSPWLDLTEEGFMELCAANPQLRFERLSSGEVIIMPPAGGTSANRSFQVAGLLFSWTRRHGGGVGFDSSAGFRLPNGAVRSPDTAWVVGERLVGLPEDELEGFLPLCPDFVAEVRSRTDRLAELRRKMEEYVENGARLGWLIDPYERSVDVYRPGREPEHLDEPDRVAGDPELPGFVMELAEIWRGLRGEG
jgi:Uma2 family endonuclease